MSPARLSFLFVVSLAAATNVTLAQCDVHEDARLTASDAAPYDRFGWSLSVNGDVMVVGASLDDCTAGSNCGAAYVYRFNGSNWVEEQKLAASDAAYNDQFGFSVSVSGDTAVVGAYLDDCLTGVRCGSAYIYRFNGSTWVEEQELTTSDIAERDGFGWSVSVSGDTAVVGAYLDDCGAGPGCGSAYVYRFNGNSWVEQAKLTASDADEWDVFGYSLSVSGDMVVVGAPQDACAVGDWCGSVYIYRFNGSRWIEEQKLTASDADDYDLFGYSTSVSGDVVIVGAVSDGCGAEYNCGSAYIYRFNPGILGWVQEAKLTLSDAAPMDYFGFSVSVSGDAAVVGAYGDVGGAGTYCGSAYVYRFNGNSWVEQAKLTASDAAQNDSLGWSVSLSGDVAIVGAPWHNCGAGGTFCGSAYVFALKDCDANGIPDECEVDCQPNGVPDDCDITSGTSADANHNSIPDECERSVLFVDYDAPGSNDGSSWCDAFVYLQDALAAARASGGAVTEIRVGQGTYKPDQGANQTPGDRTASFELVNGVAVRGGYAGCGAPDPDRRHYLVHETILSGDLDGDDELPTTSNCCSAHGTSGCDDAECEAAVCAVDALCCTVTWDSACADRADALCPNDCTGDGENALHVVFCDGCIASLHGFSVEAANADGIGLDGSCGALLNRNGTIGVSDCIFHRNMADQAGGGVCNFSDPMPGVASLNLFNCMFSENIATYGGAVRNVNAIAELHETSFHDNAAYAGAAISSVTGRLEVTSCRFLQNSAVSAGAIYGDRGETIIDRCRFEQNVVTSLGGALASYSGQLTVIDSVFADNQAEYGGAAIIESASNILGCTFIRNIVTQGTGAGFFIDTFDVTVRITNCILWHNVDRNGATESAQIHVHRGTPDVNFSCVEGLTGNLGGTGNISLDPYFLNPNANDGHLHSCSACLNSGAPGYMPFSGETDIDGEPRVMGVRVDIGADEVPHTDANSDGIADECVAGSCCEPGGLCSITLEPVCELGAWTANGNCAPGSCLSVGACCAVEGVCTIETESACGAGLWAAGGTCPSNVCLPAPTVVALGGRYLQITLAGSTGAVALRVTSPDEPCLSKYVAIDSGRPILIDNPVFLTPGAWGTLVVSDTEIIPATTYYVQATDGSAQSAYGSATTWTWGDVNMDALVDLDDIFCVLDAFAGDFSRCAHEAADLAGCVADRVIDVDDIFAVLDGFEGEPYPCSSPCP